MGFSPSRMLCGNNMAPRLAIRMRDFDLFFTLILCLLCARVTNSCL
jgi:hypothetical protein